MRTSTSQPTRSPRQPTAQTSGLASMRRWAPAKPVIQRQTDTTPPEGAEEELDPLVAAAGPGPSEEGDDAGQGVASIEAGLPFLEREEPADQAVQAKGDTTAPPLANPAAVLSGLHSASRLAPAQREVMEGHFRQGFGNVKIHTNGRANAVAASLGAQAFTYGDNIAFGAGRFRPETSAGKRLLAHELTHVVQQRQGLTGETVRRGIGQVGDHYEREADRSADALMRSQESNAGSSGRRHLPAAAQRQSMAPAIQAYSGTAAASYARTWGASTNKPYGRFSNDCTNFVSQAMLAGGWKMKTGKGYCADRKSNNVWWFKKDGCDRQWPISNTHASHTWGGAENFYWFTKTSGRGTSAGRVSDLGVGDVLQADWDSDGNISHTMIVTKSTTKNTYLTYHTSDHTDEPFWPEGKNKGIKGRASSKTSWYGWKM